MGNNKIFSTLIVFGLTGCASNDFLKDIEGKAYDSAAASVSLYCQKARHAPLILQRTRIEARREIRQRGRYGPQGPQVDVPGLDYKTAHGTGPVVFIWCEGDEVPLDAFRALVRDWRD